MLQPAQNQSAQKFTPPTTTYTPVKTTTPMEQATIGRSVVIKGEITGAEPLFIDGRVEGTINFGDSRITIGRNGVVEANISAKEIVIMGSVKGNIQCTDRLDIRAEGSLTGDVAAERISVEDGAFLKGSVEVKAGGQKSEHPQSHALAKHIPSDAEKSKSAAAGV